MIVNALTGEPKPTPKTLVQQEADFTAEGSPPPGHTTGSDVPSTDADTTTPAPDEQGGDAVTLPVPAAP
jgi:hypothetical protein